MENTIQTNVVWNAPENRYGEKTLSQHAFVSAIRGRYYEEKYEGNRSLCGKIGIGNENEQYLRLDEIESEHFDSIKACKRCAAIAQKRNIL